jgi:hypothetical protein
MLPPCLDASGGMILRAMGFGWGKQARVCFPLSLGKARGVDPPPRGHPVAWRPGERGIPLGFFM